MKITTSQNTGVCSLTTETPRDFYLLGKLAEKAGTKAQIYDQGEKYEMQIDAVELVKLAAK